MASYLISENVISVDLKKNKVFILLKSRLDYVFKSEEDYSIVEEFLGYELKGETYEPIFTYFAHVSYPFAFRQHLTASFPCSSTCRTDEEYVPRADR